MTSPDEGGFRPRLASRSFTRSSLCKYLGAAAAPVVPPRLHAEGTMTGQQLPLSCPFVYRGNYGSAVFALCRAPLLTEGTVGRCVQQDNSCPLSSPYVYRVNYGEMWTVRLRLPPVVSLHLQRELCDVDSRAAASPCPAPSRTQGTIGSVDYRKVQVVKE